MEDRERRLAQTVAARFAEIPSVTAVVMAGSRASGMQDAHSDIDLYVYALDEIDVDSRRALVQQAADQMEVDNRFWEPEDIWIDRATGIKVEAMYRSPAWIEEQLDRVLVFHQASVGYSTCFWYNVLHAEPLFDRGGWYARLQERARQPYPEPLRRAIVDKNHPILRERMSSYAHQIDSALRRDDRVSLNHRTAALLASCFDILFAVNRLPHPGEKRLVDYVEARCDLCPADFRADVTRLLLAAGDGVNLRPAVDTLMDHLDELLRREGLLPG